MLYTLRLYIVKYIRVKQLFALFAYGVENTVLICCVIQNNCIR